MDLKHILLFYILLGISALSQNSKTQLDRFRVKVDLDDPGCQNSAICGNRRSTRIRTSILEKKTLKINCIDLKQYCFKIRKILDQLKHLEKKNCRKCPQNNKFEEYNNNAYGARTFNNSIDDLKNSSIHTLFKNYDDKLADIMISSLSKNKKKHKIISIQFAYEEKLLKETNRKNIASLESFLFNFLERYRFFTVNRTELPNILQILCFERFMCDKFDVDIKEVKSNDLFSGNINTLQQKTRKTSKEIAFSENFPGIYRRIYSKWSRWTKCSLKCTTRRYKKCRSKDICGHQILREIAYCYNEGGFCQQWLHTQLSKSRINKLRPIIPSHSQDKFENISSNASGNGYIMSSKGYRGPEYAPIKLKCGIPTVRSTKKNMHSMLKISGGRPARKGDWPWQVAIFNRFKEAFCGGTLIAPQWVLTAAHCVQKILYVRLGEHNLDYDDGTETQVKVLNSMKHPSFDKKTVDSDIALLRLQNPMNATIWVGFSCLPRPFQPLPKNMECTIIGWGKRRNRDNSGTSVLHQANVPIVPMENCRSVYDDYTITKNMFCAGHKNGLIDTCAGDSGGPLLCRDDTHPNHPWTIFGITSFGDGCAKRNKFGIYARVSNYIDWIWSVINCNGNCKSY